MWGYVSYNKLDYHFEEDCHIVFEGNWTKQLENIHVEKYISRFMFDKKTKREIPKWRSLFFKLLNGRRNRDAHWDESPENIRNFIRPPPIENFLFWETRFSFFTLYASFKIMTCPEIDIESDTFKPYYKSCKEFYQLCARRAIE